MELDAKYNPSSVEDKWYSYWLKNKFFHSTPDNRPAYTIVIPPPNVTGILHMGHVLNNTIQDVLVRHARMTGYNACWVPGTDHASIATEAKVVNKLAGMGIKKRDLTREEFLKYAWEWKEEHGGIILEQLKKLGSSCDWDRTAFTMDEKRSESVMKVFVDLYEKGLIYRGLRMVNWDPKAQTVLSTEEVVYRDEKSKLYYLRYYVADTDTNPVKPTGEEGEVLHKDSEGRYYAVVATTRPETIMGDTAMCINPKDPKNRWLRGHKVVVPLVGRVIPVIEDRYVDIEFGTGCLKVTPAHDVNDYALGKTHNLDVIDIFNPDGTLSEAAGMYVGQDRMDVRRQIAIDLDKAALLEKVEDYYNKVGYSERNQDTAVEPRLCKQWFLKMQHFADIALPPVLEGKIKFHPSKYVTTYRNWLENIQDWCISRQLWWGQRIPAFYLEVEGRTETVVAETKEEVKNCVKATGMTPVRYLDSIGLLGPDVNAAHCVWLDREEWDIMAQRGVTVTHCPCSNMKLGSGLFPYEKYLNSSVRVTMGTDGASSNNNLDLREEAKFACLAAKCQGRPELLPVETAFQWATKNGAEAYGINAGEIKEGKLADAILVDMDNILMQPCFNLISNLVYSADSSCISTVICNGRILK